MHELDLILTLAGGLTAALIFGYLTHRVGLSPIVGYSLRGRWSVLTRQALWPTRALQSNLPTWA